ncbi:hypothetical protein HanIR_Chr17g0882051 [Helianthus annuus]|nr:hypothetical protein HanIR_Chr17g0882051 [Helianthus annuus]
MFNLHHGIRTSFLVFFPENLIKNHSNQILARSSSGRVLQLHSTTFFFFLFFFPLSLHQ